MKKNIPFLIAVSAMALSAGAPRAAFAQVVINCVQNLAFGQQATCSTGTLTINPDGTTSLTGCIVEIAPPQPGICYVSTGGIPITKSVRVDFPNNSINLKNGAKNMLLDNFRLDHAGAASPAAKFTFPATKIINKVTVKVGARINFTDGQTLGAYSGALTVRANEI